MEEMASLWYQESIDELKQKLIYTTLELEALKKKNKDDVQQLMQLLAMTLQERDEARDQLNKILNKLMIPSAVPSTGMLSTIPQISPQNPQVKPTRANSSITESRNFSDQPCSYHSQNSSPTESFFEAVTSPDFSKINSHQVGDLRNNMASMNQHQFVQDYNVLTGVLKVDQASLVINNLVKDKILPQRGNLLHSVLEAGPLLQTLLVAGPPPKWKNPPPLQSYHIPPPPIKGYDTQNAAVEACENSSHDPLLMNLKSYAEISCVSSQMISTSVMSFRTEVPSACAGNGRFMTSAGNVNNSVAGKRQRFH